MFELGGWAKPDGVVLRMNGFDVDHTCGRNVSGTGCCEVEMDVAWGVR